MDMLKSQGKSLLLGAPKKECPMCHKYIETHLLKIHINVHFSQILHWLFLGNFENACDIKELRRNNITYILNCAIECKNKTLPKSINELHLDVRDEPEFNIIKYFDKKNAIKAVIIKILNIYEATLRVLLLVLNNLKPICSL